MFQSIISIPKYIRQDVHNFDWKNNSESHTLKAHFFSCYKGKLVIRTIGRRSGSFGILFITRETNKRLDARDMIRHEYGHTIQLRKLGIIKYFIFIGIPSFFNRGDGLYYEKPWEVTADLFGNVQSRCPSNEVLDIGLSYLDKCREEKLYRQFLDIVLLAKKQ